MNKLEQLITKVLRAKFKFITGIEIKDTYTVDYIPLYTVFVSVDFKTLDETFPDSYIDYGYLNDINYVARDVVYIFDEVTPEMSNYGINLNNLIKSLVRSGIKREGNVRIIIRFIIE